MISCFFFCMIWFNAHATRQTWANTFVSVTVLKYFTEWMMSWYAGKIVREAMLSVYEIILRLNGETLFLWRGWSGCSEAILRVLKLFSFVDMRSWMCSMLCKRPNLFHTSVSLIALISWYFYENSSIWVSHIAFNMMCPTLKYNPNHIAVLCKSHIYVIIFFSLTSYLTCKFLQDWLAYSDNLEMFTIEICKCI